jgi:hypothetical protein
MIMFAFSRYAQLLFRNPDRLGAGAINDAETEFPAAETWTCRSFPTLSIGRHLMNHDCFWLP